MVEVKSQRMSRTGWFKEFGKALEPTVVRTSALALVVGFIGGLVAQGLLELIYLFTNIFFYGKWSFAITSPVHHHLGAWVILIPPIGGLLVGIMIYVWEPTLKGHGIPEAREAVLVGKSLVRMRVGILKPLATAFAIGTGGPFGAEGPIIQTGAAFGSIFAQVTKLTPYQRRVLLASGAAAGMAATFVAPFAGILVAIELLLFEFRARSFIPVAISSVVATAVAVHFRGWAPLFPTPAFSLKNMQELWLFALMGLIMGLIGIAMIRVLFWLEHLFDNHFPLKPRLIWAPAFGGRVRPSALSYFRAIRGAGAQDRWLNHDTQLRNRVSGLAADRCLSHRCGGKSS
jgi:H+/Cl- antiporter ClcA